MSTQPYLRSQTDLLADMRAMMRDPAGQRWTDAEVMRSLNRALLAWQGRVAVDHYYTLPSGYSASTYEYDLPGYVRPPVVAEVKRFIPYEPYHTEVQTTYTWQPIPSMVEPSGTGGLKLRLIQPPFNLDGRVRFKMPNGPLPLSVESLGSNCTSTATTATLTGEVDVADTGFVKCENEWMAYAGISRGSETILNNVLRGLYGTTAAGHNDDTDVEWGVAAPSLALYAQLYDQAAAYLHELYLTDGSEKERLNHEKMMGFHQQRADSFWETYNQGVEQSTLHLSQRSIYR